MAEEVVEVFKNIPGYDGAYQISNLGRLWSVKRQRFLKPSIGKNGYEKVNLQAPDKRQKTETIHRLVALLFVENPKPKEWNIVNHKDEDKLNNNADNLEWCDRKYNNNYSYEKIYHWRDFIND